MTTKLNIYIEDKIVIFRCLDCGEVVMLDPESSENFKKVEVEYQIFVLSHVHVEEGG